MVQVFRLIRNWVVASKGWSTGVSGSLVAEAGLQIMMVLDHPSSNDLLSLLLVLDGSDSLTFGHPPLCHSYYVILASI